MIPLNDEIEIPENDLIRRAYLAFGRRGPAWDCPDGDATVEQRRGISHVIVRNVRMVVAVYRVETDGTLRALNGNALNKWCG
jgi:hypothetical protein